MEKGFHRIVNRKHSWKRRRNVPHSISHHSLPLRLNLASKDNEMLILERRPHYSDGNCMYTVGYIFGIVKNCPYYRCGDFIVLRDRIVSVLQIREMHAAGVCGPRRAVRNKVVSVL